MQLTTATLESILPLGLVLVGAGGHAKVIVEIFRESGDWKVIGCVSKSAAGETILGVPVLGGDEHLYRLFSEGVRHAFVAIGDNRTRARVSGLVQSLGFQLVSAISRGAIISPSVRMATGIAVMAGAVINADSSIGEGAVVNTGATVDHDCFLGEYCHVGPGTNLAGGVTLNQGVYLGIGSLVIPQVTIGEWATVGAGGVVISNLPAHCTAVGVPARVIKTGRQV